ncbi:hypothetical protein [Sandaracinus amylolyticus]|uniref:Uncharacterized protein n=1 Tax=Sandaracinus amylolyticus TaxID=927083 RepID=A0A0F6SF03_9BACT|nr:hypothetical protein [Sandaracinus amylolyticus]AKF06094.1 hypothetical protein DB32_003243 [Sandaracinus amylolyticus]
MKAPIGSPMDVYVPHPRGVGVFLASGDVARMAASPMKLGREAELLVAARARWVAIWVESPDGAPRRASLATVQRVADGLRGFGLGVSVWSFPRPGEAARAGQHLGRIATAIGAELAILDVEDPDGARGPLDWEADHARMLVDATIEELRERTMLAVTSYPGRVGHGLPWGELAAGIGMPQVYGTADRPQSAAAAVRSWRDVHGAVIPITSLRSPGAQHANVDAAQLRARMSAIALEDVTAIALWSWALLRVSLEHRAAVAAWSDARAW